MPYEIVPFRDGFRVKKKGERKYFSKHPLSLDDAKLHLRALYVNHHKGLAHEDEMKGEGFFDVFKKIGSVLKNVVKNDTSFNTEKALKDYGENMIKIGRAHV